MSTTKKNLSSPAVQEQLLAAAKYHTRAAAQCADSDEAFMSLDSVIHAGNAIELFAKLLLSRIDEKLLRPASPHVLFDAVAELRQIPNVTPSQAKWSKTIEAGQALELIERFCEEVRPHISQARTILKQRNAAVHMAEPDPDLNATVVGVQLFAAACLETLKQDAADLLGVQRLSEIRAAYRSLEEQTRKSADEAIDGAIVRYRSLIDGLSVEKQRDLAVIMASKTQHKRIGDDGWEIECPACEYSDAWFSQEIEYEQDEDGTYAGGVAPLGLDCPRCGLSLDAKQLALIDFDMDDPREPDWDLGEREL